MPWALRSWEWARFGVLAWQGRLLLYDVPGTSRHKPLCVRDLNQAVVVAVAVVEHVLGRTAQLPGAQPHWLAAWSRMKSATSICSAPPSFCFFLFFLIQAPPSVTSDLWRFAPEAPGNCLKQVEK